MPQINIKCVCVSVSVSVYAYTFTTQTCSQGATTWRPPLRMYRRLDTDKCETNKSPAASLRSPPAWNEGLNQSDSVDHCHCTHSTNKKERNTPSLTTRTSKLSFALRHFGLASVQKLCEDRRHHPRQLYAGSTNARAL